MPGWVFKAAFVASPIEWGEYVDKTRFHRNNQKLISKFYFIEFQCKIKVFSATDKTNWFTNV